MRRVLAVLLMLVPFAALSFAQGPPHGGPGGPPPQGQGPGGMRGGGFAPPPFPGDSMATQRDSLMNVVMKSIAGKESMPAESVFKDIKTFKGRHAGDIPRIMNYGFGRSLGVGCYHCHAQNDWAKDEKKQKRIAREMAAMAAAINTDYLSKIEGLGPDRPPGAGGPGGPQGEMRRPSVNCSTCHRGSIYTGGGPGGPRPGGPPPGGAR